MRVRISYSVNLEEVPEKSSTLLREAYAQLDKSSRIVRELASDVKNNLISKEALIDAIEEIRIQLGGIDASISDASMIMSGYHDAKEKLETPIEETVLEETVLEEGEYGAD